MDNEETLILMSSPQFELRKQAFKSTKEKYGGVNKEIYEKALDDKQFKNELKTALIQRYNEISNELNNDSRGALKNVMNANSMQEMINIMKNDKESQRSVNLFHDMQIHKAAIRLFDPLHSVIMN